MADDGHAVHAHERGSANLAPVHPLLHGRERVLGEDSADLRGHGAAQRFLHELAHRACGALHGLQCHVSREAVGDDHVEVALEEVPALAVALEAQRRALQRRSRRPGHGRSLRGLLAVRQHRHPGSGNALDAAAVDLAHEGELHEMHRPAVHVGSNVDQHRGPLHRRQHREDGRPLDRPGAAENEHGPRHDGAAVAGAHHPRRLAALHELEAGADGVLLLAAHRLSRVVAHLDDLGCMLHLDGQAPTRPLTLELAAHALLGPDQDDGLALARCVNGAVNDDGRGVVAPHGVDGDRRDARGHPGLGALDDLSVLVVSARRAGSMR